MKQQKRCTVRELLSMIGDSDMDDEVVISLSNLPQKVRGGNNIFPIIGVDVASASWNGGAEGVVYLETFDDFTEDEDNRSIETEEEYKDWLDHLSYRTQPEVE